MNIMQEPMNAAVSSSTSSVERALKSAILKHTGQDTVDESQILAHGSKEVHRQGFEVFLWDGEPIFEVGPVKVGFRSEGLSHFVDVTREYRELGTEGAI